MQLAGLSACLHHCCSCPMMQTHCQHVPASRALLRVLHCWCKVMRYVEGFRHAAMQFLCMQAAMDSKLEAGGHHGATPGRPDIRSILKQVQSEFSHIQEIHVHAAGGL